MKAADSMQNCGPVDYGISAPTECTSGPLELDFTSQTFSLSLQGGQKKLGAPPTELADLVARTLADADAVHTAESKVSGACGQTMTDACTRALIPVYAAKDKLLADFDAWKPYTH